jgi:plasmid maintenance system antidote protein VapI
VRGEIPVSVVREPFERSGMSVLGLAKIVGCDESHIARIMGRRIQYVWKNGRRCGPYERKTISYEMAVRIADALGIDPVDLDL